MLDYHPSEHSFSGIWQTDFSGPDFPKEPVIDATLFTHGVNIGQAIKSSGVWFRQSQNSSDYKSSFDRIDI